MKFFSALLVPILMGCSSVPPPKVITVEERIKLNDSLGGELARSLDDQIKTLHDPALSDYLTRTAERISAQHPELRLSPVSTVIVKNRDDVWRSYSLPGNRLYMSAGALKLAEFENELAGLLGLQLAHVQSQHVARKLESQRNVGAVNPGSAPPPPIFFGPLGLFDFSEKDTLEATEAAVNLIYQAGYDPRGLVSVWLKFQKSKKNSPYDSRSIIKFIEKTRQTIAAHSPLRNPVISSEEFLKNKKRMQRL